MLFGFDLSAIRHFRNDKGTGAEMCLAFVSGMVTGDVPVSYWPIPLCPKQVPEFFAKVNSASLLLVFKVANQTFFLNLCNLVLRALFDGFGGKSTLGTRLKPVGSWWSDAVCSGSKIYRSFQFRLVLVLVLFQKRDGIDYQYNNALKTTSNFIPSPN